MLVVYVDMVADLFHVGHLRMLQRASTYGDVIVGIHDDETVQSYKRTPIIPHDQRVSMVEACRYVSRVISHAPLYITEDFLNQHNMDLVAHAHAEHDAQYEDMYRVPIALGKFLRLDYTAGISTTDILRRCANAVSTA